MQARLGEAVGQPAHPDHQRRRWAGGRVEIGAEFVDGHADPGSKLGQLQAGPFEEDKLLRAARMFERATDWHVKRPTNRRGG